ncbi:MAG: SDR family oxidoreductase [Verrucomicrobiota bacterium]
MRYEGKRVAVTGGASGIGEAMARQFAEEGAEVLVVDLASSQGEAVAQNLAGDRGTFGPCDMTNGAAVKSLFSDYLPDVLVNNAGISHIGTALTTEEADLDRVYQVNIKGVFHGLKAVIPLMQAKGGGVILNMASIASKMGLPDRFAYSMSKGAVLSMTLCVAKDHLADKIRCNCLCPARVHTPFVDAFLEKHYPGQEKEMFDKLSAAQPIGRMAQPEEVAKLATYLCSEDADFVTGVAWDIDGGFMTIR